MGLKKLIRKYRQKSLSSSHTEKDFVTKLNQHDVLMGRGTKIGMEPGNQNFRKVCWKYKAEYLAAERNQKQEIAKKVLSEIASMRPSGHVYEGAGNGKFVLVDFDRAVEKTCQYLREKKCSSPVEAKASPAKPTSRKQAATLPRKQSTKRKKYVEPDSSDEESDDDSWETEMLKAIIAKKKKKIVPIISEKAIAKITAKKKKNLTKIKSKIPKEIVATVTKKSPPARIPPSVEVPIDPPDGLVRRRSLRIAIKNSASSYGDTVPDDSFSSPLPYKVKAEENPATRMEGLESLAMAAESANTLPPKTLQHPGHPTLLKMSKPPSQYPEPMKEDQDHSKVPPAPELLHGLSGYSLPGGDNFDKELEGITAPPLTSFTSRQLSSFSAYQEFGNHDHYHHERVSPQGVTDIMLPPEPNLKAYNSLYFDGMTAEGTGASISQDIFSKDEPKVHPGMY